MTSADKPVEVGGGGLTDARTVQEGDPPERKQLSIRQRVLAATTLPRSCWRGSTTTCSCASWRGPGPRLSGDLLCCELRSTDARVALCLGRVVEERMTKLPRSQYAPAGELRRLVELTTKLCFEEIVGSREAKAALAPYSHVVARRSESVHWCGSGI